ncbi:hypothetical protein [Microvirga pakistanensis]|uniref:hypothetical protein n=1 Tax=Microvirga pakistanensis TaxID=1682650 RepID=UPI00106B1D42|nr:hypothetical protein [Microvirga pakistanensis]
MTTPLLVLGLTLQQPVRPKVSASMRRGKSDVSLMLPDLQRPHNLVCDGKSSEPRRPLVDRQKAGRCQANYEDVTLRRGAAGDDRGTLWYTKRLEQLLADPKVRLSGNAIRALGIGHSAGRRP